MFFVNSQRFTKCFLWNYKNLQNVFCKFTKNYKMFFVKLQKKLSRFDRVNSNAKRCETLSWPYPSFLPDLIRPLLHRFLDFKFRLTFRSQFTMKGRSDRKKFNAERCETLSWPYSYILLDLIRPILHRFLDFKFQLTFRSEIAIERRSD